MIVADVMTTFPDAVDPDTSVRKAAQLMRDGDYGVLPVVNMDGSLVGIVTDRDIVIKIVADGQDSDTPVSRCMTPDPDTVPKDLPLEQAMTLMSKRQVRRMPVVEYARLVGMLSLGDIATSKETDHEKADTLAEVSLNKEFQQSTSQYSREELPGI